ncbi:MAG TPA: UbiA-like polyprenyltransferase [Gemmatimonadaceae bacterium]|jgi:4-hydroxybenzoate polyprenyltransferase|nr:UbiA-like polyprenyltransferase [Gemmatimonadaceae bacterium]
MTTPVREGQTFTGPSGFVRYVNLVKLPHTVFALPFALVGVTLASYVAPVTVSKVIWVIIAFTSARFAAMGFNRIVDRDVDALNPRTKSREIPAGILTVSAASAAVVIACAVFVIAAWQLNQLCLWLSPLALAWVLFYSYTKRFTRLCHLVLGIGLSIAPVGGYLAVTGQWSDPWWMLVLLATAVATWVGGFDILYALQDIDFDCAQGLHSLPAALGERPALDIARALHVTTVLCLAVVGLAVGAHWIFFAGVAVAAILLLYEHSLVKPGDLSRLDAAFFTMNGVISIAFFGFVLAERLAL